MELFKMIASKVGKVVFDDRIEADTPRTAREQMKSLLGLQSLTGVVYSLTEIPVELEQLDLLAVHHSPSARQLFKQFCALVMHERGDCPGSVHRTCGRGAAPRGRGWGSRGGVGQTDVAYGGAAALIVGGKAEILRKKLG